MKNTKHMHDSGCSCLKKLPSKCDCKQGLDRKIWAKAKDNLKRSKVIVTEVVKLKSGVEMEWTWDPVREFMIGCWAKIPFGEGKIGRLII